MALQFLVGGVVSVINIMIHALVTIGAVGIARSAGLRRPAAPTCSISPSSTTSLGYGDITPVQAWRLNGPMTAMNGILMFGWSTAVLFEVLRKTLDHLASIGVPRDQPC